MKDVQICGESGDVRGKMVQAWKERLPEILPALVRRISGVLMKQVYLGEDCQKRDLGRKEKRAGVERKTNKG